jgi:hypothetical protein
MSVNWVCAAPLTLKTTQEGQGLSHRVIVESPANFKLVFENGLNYGLSQWFDLHHDPKALIDLTDNPIVPETPNEQGALFNQCLNPDDMIAHVAGARSLFKDVLRSIKIIEQGPLRVILENRHHPMFGRIKNDGLLFKTRYTIYADGKIFINNMLIGLKAQQITMWRNSIVGLSDPSYKANTLQGQMTVVNNKVIDKTQNWRVNQWVGFQLNLPDWRSFNIKSNTKDTLVLGRKIAGSNKPISAGPYELDSKQVKYGWLRGDEIAFPHQWHKDNASFIYASWDPTTPAPNTNWTSASIMLVPAPGNEKQGHGVGLHGWRGFKRMYYEYGGFYLKKDQTISQDYMLVLGSNSNKNLPDLRHHNNATKTAKKYIKSTKFKSFDASDGSFDITLKKGAYNFLTAKEGFPYAFEVNSTAELQLYLDGDLLVKDRDYLIQPTSKDGQILKLAQRFTAYDTLAMFAR